MVLLAGPSGSGKSRVARLAGCPLLALDDFYLDGDRPGLPRARGIVDWDDVRTWDVGTAVATIELLCRFGTADVPVYDIATSRRIGTAHLALGPARSFVAEGVFAPDLLGPCRDAGLVVVPLYLNRPRTLTLLLRLVRDLRERRKPPWVLVRRGLALWRTEPSLRSRALAAGFLPVGLRRAVQCVREQARPSVPSR